MLKRANVIMVMYDLPVTEKVDARIASQFRKNLVKDGFIMFQESVYVKLIHNRDITKNEIEQIKRMAPKSGNLNALTIGLTEFRRMQSLMGKAFDMKIFSDEICEI